jgi:hypothetical protein
MIATTNCKVQTVTRVPVPQSAARHGGQGSTLEQPVWDKATYASPSSYSFTDSPLHLCWELQIVKLKKS